MMLAERWDPAADVSLYLGDTLELLAQMPDACAQLVITSPPYNIDKEYERGKRLHLADYLANQQQVVDECVRILRPGGSICWEIGNHVAKDEIYPLDILLYPIFKRHPQLKLRNRIIWHFEHGLHCTKRLSGRHEAILWFTNGSEYTFNLDAIRVPQKYPGKRAWKGPQAGQYTSNPLGKNPGDVWIFPNVKSNHIEKTVHPCQFPIELVERFVLATTVEGDLIFDPYMGVGSTACAAVLHRRRAAGADVVSDYIQIARRRVELAASGKLQTRPMDRPVHQPKPNSALTRRDDITNLPTNHRQTRPPAQGLRIASGALGNDDGKEPSPAQLSLLETSASYGT